jgi:SecD/SecF fusion protein
MKQFTWRIVWSVLPVVLAAYFVGVACNRYVHGESGTPSFKLGVDLVGGTILVYEVDLDKFPDRKLPDNYKPEELAASLKRRIDPTDLYNVTIRPVSNTRVEIILPTGGAHQARIEEQGWQSLLEQVRQKWPALTEQDVDVPRGQREQLVSLVRDRLEAEAWKELLTKAREKWPKLKDVKLETIKPGFTAELTARIQKELDKNSDQEKKEVPQFVEANYKPPSREIEEFVDTHYRSGKKRKDLTGEEVQRIKELISQVGSLEFRILANDQDDKEAVNTARDYIHAQNDQKLSEEERAKRKEELEKAALQGFPPPPPKPAEGNFFETPLGRYTYSWVELGREERHDLGLDNASEQNPRPGSRWVQAAEARTRGETLSLDDGSGKFFGLLYSRKCVSRKLTESERNDKKYEYFMLTRDPEPGKEITGQYLVNASEGVDRRMQPCVNFRFNNKGGDLFYDLTSKNGPSGAEGSRFYRHLAIVLDGQIVSAPRLNEPIRTDGQITGGFTKKKVDQLVSILRAGQLPASLKGIPVSENTIGPTLGEYTIRAGTYSVGVAFVAILAFMLVYYRFAGLVACVALMANLLLTVGFMVLVNATFTLPGLAGLVLMLGMAVDANVLIYERLREERDRGASLALAIRNGYDRAFPTIIDTHLSSIFTAIVLYVVGNDQLKGFGVSLTVGLIISLFTSLYMTRLMFDLWLAKGWLHKLSMFRLFSRPNIDFMGIRYYWFTATVLLTVFGITVFLIRGKEGLNIDFVGGTAYGGRLEEGEAKTASQLRALLDEDRQKELLKVESVKQLDEKGRSFEITYAAAVPQKVQRIELANAPGRTREEREQNVKERAQILPDWSVEQIFLSTEPSEGGKSRYFTIRTSEKEPDLVQVTIDRLLRENRDGQWVSLLEKIDIAKAEPVKGKEAREEVLTFNKPASPGQVKMLLEREFRALGIEDSQPAEVHGEGHSHEGRYEQMRVDLSDPVAAQMTPEKLQKTIEGLKTAFASRPQPERLENFDSQLAAETQKRAAYAILASWAAILLYLWFRFGNWTFGLAAVLCLIHDLFFTLGIIAFCHYVHVGAPTLAHYLGLQDFKIDLPAVAALLTLVGYSVNDTIVVFDRIREVRGKNPELTPQMINDSVNQTLSRTLLTSFATWLVVIVLYIWGGEGVHLFAFVMVVGVVVGTYSSIYIASPLLLIFGEGTRSAPVRERRPVPEPEGAVT